MSSSLPQIAILPPKGKAIATGSPESPMPLGLNILLPELTERLNEIRILHFIFFFVFIFPSAICQLLSPERHVCLSTICCEFGSDHAKAFMKHKCVHRRRLLLTFVGYLVGCLLSYFATFSEDDGGGWGCSKTGPPPRKRPPTP